MDTKKHILFLPSWYPNKYFPQNGDFIQRHALAAAEFCNITVLFFKSVDKKEDRHVSDTKNGNLREIIVYTGNKIFILPVFIKYFKIIHSENPIDLIHLNVVYPAGILALITKKLFKIPFVYTEHWTVFTNGKFHNFSWIKKLIIRNIIRNTSTILPVSEQLKKSMQDSGISGNFHIVDNVVNTQIFHPKARKKISEKTVFLHVSSLKDEHKNISGIIRAVKKLLVLRTDFKIIIAGNNDFDRFEKLAHELEILPEIIEFRGNMPQYEIAELIREASCFVLFSNYENAPCVISEAHACGIPVISSRVGGIPDMIDNSNGILVQAEDVEGLAGEMFSFLSGKYTFNSSLISENAIKRYSFSTVGEKLHDIYKRIINPEKC